MDWTYDRSVTSDFERAESLEWLETNGVGGWAASTVGGAHSRRYHGLLVAATTPPTGRLVLLSRLDETVTTPAASFELAANRFPDAVHPTGHRRLERFTRGVFPVFDYVVPGARLRKTVAAIHGENTTVVLYELLEADAPVELELRPFFAGRDYHSLAHANDAIARGGNFSGGVLAYRAYSGQPEVRLGVTGAAWSPRPDWWRSFEYARERERGLDFREDLFTPGVLTLRLEPGARKAAVISTDRIGTEDGFDLVFGERTRREAWVAPWQDADPLCRALATAADAYIVRRGDDLRTIVAGYPWFTDWGRDTMIALPGLCLTTGASDEAQRILRAFARAADRGMLPNRFPDRGETPEFNTVDASLWFFVAVHAYFEKTDDAKFVRDELLPVLRDIVEWHRNGTRHGIREDADGLLLAGEPGVQLTWMDAKVGDWVVTPRHGKPVEINALWYNAQAILAGLEAHVGTLARAKALRAAAGRTRESFLAAFVDPDGGGLYDVIGPDGPDRSIRPNQIFALSLPHPLLTGEGANAVLDVVRRQLLTPCGLRSLAPSDPRYVPRYEGGVLERDGAYHQGTVWTWLLGPYITALVRVAGEQGRLEARELLRGLEPRLAEACVGQLDEIYDAEPPHAPRGCPAQAWSVAEVLRAAVEDVGLAHRTSPQRARSARGTAFRTARKSTAKPRAKRPRR